MKAKHVLVPLDLLSSPADALICTRNMAMVSPLSVTLLYVLHLNVALPSREVYDELCAEAETALRRLARFFFGTDRAVRIVVRVGAPGAEIVAEAKSQHADLIILSKSSRPAWKGIFRRAVAQKVIDASPCPALLLPGAGRVLPPNCLPVSQQEAFPIAAALPAA